MRSRALGLAAFVMLALGAMPAWAQNLDAGKSPAQLFQGTCTVCHKSARGLLRTVSPGSLPGFLRQHYTTGSDMASMLAGYLVANGAGAPGGREARPSAAESAPRGRRREREPAPTEQAGRPDRDGLTAEEPARHGRKSHQKPAEASAPAEAGEVKPKTGRHHKPVVEEAKPQKPAEAPAEPATAAKPEPQPADHKPAPGASDAAIDAAIPKPEPANVPPPTAADIKPSDVKPAETKPADTKPAAEAKPSEIKPAEAKPAEAKPAEAKPAEAKPAEAKPAESKPAGSQSAAPPKAPDTASTKPDHAAPASDAGTAAPGAPVSH